MQILIIIAASLLFSDALGGLLEAYNKRKKK